MSWLDGASNFIDNAISFLSPERGLKRIICRNRVSRIKQLYDDGPNRSFDAISGDRKNSGLLSFQNDADSAINGSLEGLRNHIRQLEYNNGHIAGPIQRIADNVVGTGLRFQARVRADKKSTRLGEYPRITKQVAEQFNFMAEKLFRIWSKQADVRLINNFHELQWIIQAALVRDGECLVIGRYSKKDMRLIPYCQQVIEIDRLTTPPDEFNNPSIRNGIKFDEEGAPEAYFILNRHPGNGSIGLNRNDYDEIPVWNPNGTRKILHLFRILRPEQTRGFSALAAGLKSLQRTVKYSDAEMFAALEDACMTGIVKTEAPATFQENYTVADGATDAGGNRTRIHEFAPGKWHYLEPGEDVTIRDPKRPNDKFDEIIKAFLREPANALNIPNEVFLQDWKDMNYSNARTVLLEFWRTCRKMQRYMVDHYCGPSWENVLADFVTVGKINAPDYAVRRDDYLACEWIPPKREWVDPVREANGKTIELQSLTTTRGEIIAGQGGDFEETIEAAAAEAAFIAAKEEEYGIKLPVITQEKSSPSQDAEEQDDDKQTNSDNNKGGQ